jgi:hypothetical protein
MADLVTDLTDEDIRTELTTGPVTAEADDDATDPGDATDGDDDATDADDDATDPSDDDGTDA